MKNVIKLIAVLALFGTTSVSARDYISIVGSSTVYPFATLVAEKMASEGMKAPVIESTGSGGGHKLFCAGVGVEHPDITNSSRAQKDKEFKLCQDGGVTDIIEVRVGNDGIAFAYAADYEWKYTNGATMKGGIDLTKEEIWQAMARDNANAPTTWYEIDKRLPKVFATGPKKFDYAYNPKMLTWLDKNINRYDLIIVNGAWQYHNYAVWKIAKKFSDGPEKYTEGRIGPIRMLILRKWCKAGMNSR